MSVRGDSGSVVMDANTGNLTGLIFAGSNEVSMFTPLRQVLEVFERHVLQLPRGSLRPA